MRTAFSSANALDISFGPAPSSRNDAPMASSSIAAGLASTRTPAFLRSLNLIADPEARIIESGLCISLLKSPQLVMNL